MPAPAQTPDRGEWVVLLDGAPVGRGATAVAAAAAARRRYPHASFTYRFVEALHGDPLALAPLLEKLHPLFAALPRPVYLVGGAVRDGLLGNPSHDLDFVVPEKGIKTAFTIGNKLGAPAYVLDKERDTGRVVLDGGEVHLDFARFRGGDLAADLRARDFTINALALPATAVRAVSVIDVTGGVADLQARRLRLATPDALQSDAARALRAVRLAYQLDFSLPAETRAAIMASIPRLATTSRERQRDELVKMIQLAAPHKPLAALAEFGLLEALFPDLAALRGLEQSPPHHEPVWAHTLTVLEQLCQIEQFVTGKTPAHNAADLLTPYRDELIAQWARTFDGGLDGRTLGRLGALFHDIGKGETRTITEDGRIRFFDHDRRGAEITGGILRRFAFSKQVQSYVQRIVAGHMRPLLLANNAQISRRAIYRFFRDTEEAGIEILLIALADHLATYRGTGPAASWAKVSAVVSACLYHYFRRHTETVAPPPVVDGRALMNACNIPPGPEVGRLLQLIQEQQAMGAIQTPEEAIEFARQNCSR